jgi:two-component system CheB/CheR fusion protein
MADLETSRVLVRVTDEGNGIAAEDIPRVMEPFFSTRLAQGGTGLGLYISHTIISNHKGTMDIASSQGKGTVVTLRLPQMEDQRHLLSDTMEGFTATHQSAGTPPPTH